MAAVESFVDHNQRLFQLFLWASARVDLDIMIKLGSPLETHVGAINGYDNRANKSELVQVILYDGRVIVGKLRGYDPRTNVILSDCVEREYSMDQGVEMIPLGLYMIKGDNVAMVAEMDEEKDSTIDYTEVKAEPLGEIKF